MKETPPLREDLEKELLGVMCECAAMGPTTLGELLLCYEELREAAWSLCFESHQPSSQSVMVLRKALSVLHAG